MKKERNWRPNPQINKITLDGRLFLEIKDFDLEGEYDGCTGYYTTNKKLVFGGRFHRVDLLQPVNGELVLVGIRHDFNSLCPYSIDGTKIYGVIGNECRSWEFYKPRQAEDCPEYLDISVNDPNDRDYVIPRLHARDGTVFENQDEACILGNHQAKISEYGLLDAYKKTFEAIYSLHWTEIPHFNEQKAFDALKRVIDATMHRGDDGYQIRTLKSIFAEIPKFVHNGKLESMLARYAA